MSGLFFGNRDIDVRIKGELTFNFEILNKCIIITDEADIDILELSGESANSELQEYLTENTISCPKLQKAVNVFVGQSDNDGNRLLPESVFVIGRAVIGEIPAAIEAATVDYNFYCLIPTFENQEYNIWFQTYSASKNRIGHIFTSTLNKELLDTEKTQRAIGIYDGATSPEFKNAAWAGRILNYGKLIGWKFKHLNGVNTDSLSDGVVGQLEDKGWNGYRKVRGLGETTGSRTTINVSSTDSRIDDIFVRDNIIYNVANALSTLLKKREILTMGIAGVGDVKQTISSVLNYCGSIGLIEEFPDGSYKFKVNVPEQTGAAKGAREFQNVSFEYERKYAGETIKVTGNEVLNFIN